MRFFLFFILSALVATVSFATDVKTVYAQYRKIIDDQGKTDSERVKLGQEYLQSLERLDFLEFIRESSKELGCDDKDEGVLMAMAVFAQSYLVRAGKEESPLDTLKQVEDPTLPSAWKIGLLDALNLENRSDLSESEVAEITKILAGKIQNKEGSERFRSFCIQKLGSFLFTQREIIMQKAPDLKDALEKQDRVALPKRDDTNVRQAEKLIDSIRDYKNAIQKMADEVNDEKIKANLIKRLENWQSTPVTPTK